MYKSVQHQGFTLIELLITMAIIGVLATIGIISFTGSQERARDAARKSDLRSIQTALEVFKNDHGFAPRSPSNFTIWGCTTAPTEPTPTTGDECLWGSAFSANSIVYMNRLPHDPKYDAVTNPGYEYRYERTIPNDLYTLSACLENGGDDSCTSTAAWCNALTNSEGCVYTVAP